MTLLWHIVRKDARRLAIPLAAWAVLITAHQAAVWWLPQLPQDDRLGLQWMEWFTKMLFTLRLGIGYVLAAGIVMEDPAAGTNVFWKSLPVSGTRMFAAKALGCAVLLVIAPLLLGAPWWLLTSETGSGVPTMPAYLWQWHAAVAGLGMAVATFSGTANAFLGWTVGLPAGALAASIMVTEQKQFSPGVIRAALADAPRRMELAVAVIAVALLLAVAVRYQRRSLRVAGALVVGGMAAAALLVWQALG